VWVSFSVRNGGNINLLHKAASVMFGTTPIALTASMCNGDPTQGSKLGMGDANVLECTVPYSLTQADIEAPWNLRASVKFDTYYFSCTEKNTDACNNAIVHEASAELEIPKIVSMSKTVATDSTTYNAVGKRTSVAHKRRSETSRADVQQSLMQAASNCF
jgi:hypothetical protein